MMMLQTRRQTMAIAPIVTSKTTMRKKKSSKKSPVAAKGRCGQNIVLNTCMNMTYIQSGEDFGGNRSLQVVRTSCRIYCARRPVSCICSRHRGYIVRQQFPAREGRSHPYIVCPQSWQAMVYYMYTSKISFAPLKSEGARARRAAIENYKLLHPDVPPLCSPKSMYRLADIVRQNLHHWVAGRSSIRCRLACQG
jgi:hypothetical protein